MFFNVSFDETKKVKGRIQSRVKMTRHLSSQMEHKNCSGQMV